jgi:hypothetical protein
MSRGKCSCVLVKPISICAVNNRCSLQFVVPVTFNLACITFVLPLTDSFTKRHRETATAHLSTPHHGSTLLSAATSDCTFAKQTSIEVLHCLWNDKYFCVYHKMPNLSLIYMAGFQSSGIFSGLVVNSRRKHSYQSELIVQFTYWLCVWWPRHAIHLLRDLLFSRTPPPPPPLGMAIFFLDKQTQI